MSSHLPFVSILTPTFNRRRMFPLAIHCFKHQTYPAHRMEWIILDDSLDPEKDVQPLLEEAGLLNDPRVRYIRILEEKKMPIGAKRAKLCELAKGDVLANQDDDDYYPPERIAHGVRLLQNSLAQIVGSTVTYMYYAGSDGAVYKAGPYGRFNGTAGTWMFKRSLLETSSFDLKAEKAEETQFLRKYSVPMVQADPMKTILVISHEANTVDKEKMRDGIRATSTGMKLKHFMKKDVWAIQFLKSLS
jgi:glycosyltransferase involved in cell wall biosynthesis